MKPKAQSKSSFLSTTSTAALSSSTSTGSFPSSGDDDKETITILGFGSLLSESSSRLTFPDLSNFRLARVPNYRRVFGHPTSIFFQRGIADIETKQMSSLSVEYDEGNPGFIASVFDVSNKDMMEDGVPSPAFLEREEEFDIITVPYHPIENGKSDPATEQNAIICARSSDEAYVQRWGEEHFRKQYGQYGVNTIWNWDMNSGLRPCAVYLRHCFLAAKSNGEDCYRSFLDETFLVDRTTTVRHYLDQYPEVLDTLPPPSLVHRYSG
jgi:hypothetical protein